ncbi:3-deoxy-manno-octulosonate cytidylyltransferase [Vibrio azureus]|nr:3-deoxy-manno-octulosonate cytidylyltransferase [Vibrio azureus]
MKVVIPARFGSTRLPGKPLLPLCGKPIFWHVFQRANEAGIPTKDIVVATDDERIYSEAVELGIPCIMTAIEHVSGTDRLNEVASRLKWTDETVIINIQGDEPLIPSQLIQCLIKFTNKMPSFDITTVVSPIRTIDDLINPNVVKVAIGENGRAVYFSRSAIPFNREEPTSIEYAYRHIGIYAYSVRSLRQFCKYPESDLETMEKLEQLRALSNGLSIGATIFEQSPPHGIDTEKDYINIKLIMEKENVSN